MKFYDTQSVKTGVSEICLFALLLLSLSSNGGPNLTLQILSLIQNAGSNHTPQFVYNIFSFAKVYLL